MSTSIIHSVRKARQIAVFIDDVPGTLSEVTSLLSRHDINIYALSLAEGIGHGHVRMVVDNPDEAIRILREAEELVIEREVLLVDLVNVRGALGDMTRKLAEAGINLEYAYCAGGPSVEKGLVVVRVDQTDKALAVLNKG